MINYSVIVACAGSGTRSKLDYNKIFYKIEGKEVISYTLTNFINDEDCKEIILVCKDEERKRLKDLLENNKIKYVTGGNTRTQSITNGLQEVSYEYVLIHDGARPFLTKELLERIKKGLEVHEAIIPVISVKDTVKVVENNKIIKTLDRNKLCLVQTPQGFKTKTIVEAYANLTSDASLFDDASVLELLNKDVFTVEGDSKNIKLTNKEDFDL